jgi:hypothetical protein
MQASSSLPVLRALRLGELLDQAIRLYRRNFLTFIGIIAVVYVPLMILQTISSTWLSSSLLNVSAAQSPEEIFSNSSYWLGLLSTVVLGFLQIILVQGIANGALTRAVADNYLGRKTNILDAYRGIGKSWVSLLGALLLLGVVFLVATLWSIVPCIGWVTGPGMIAFLLMAVNPMVAPVVVLEGKGALDAIQRAWSLTRRRFWPVLGYIFVLSLFSLLVVNGPVAIVNAVLPQFLGSFEDPTMRVVVLSIIQMLVTLTALLIYYPLQMTALTLIYFDLRVRTEGFDLALLTMNESELADTSQAMTAPPSQPTERLMTGADLGNFAILTLLAAGVYILFFTFIAGGAFFLSSLIR